MIDGKALMEAGKYYNKTYYWVLTHDLCYCRWVLSNCDRGPLFKFSKWLSCNAKDYKPLLHPALDLE